MAIHVCLAGATGWAGSALARAIAGAEDLRLVGAVGRRHAGLRLGDVLADPRLDVVVSATAADAVAGGCDVLVEYTSTAAAKANVTAALVAGAHVVIGS